MCRIVCIFHELVILFFVERRNVHPNVNNRAIGAVNAVNIAKEKVSLKNRHT